MARSEPTTADVQQFLDRTRAAHAECTEKANALKAERDAWLRQPDVAAVYEKERQYAAAIKALQRGAGQAAQILNPARPQSVVARSAAVRRVAEPVPLVRQRGFWARLRSLVGA